MQRTEHRSQIFDTLPALRYPLFITIKSGDIDSVGPAHIQSPVAVEILQSGPLRCRDHRAEIELFPHHADKGKRHAIGIGKSKVRKAVADDIRTGDGLTLLSLQKC